MSETISSMPTASVGHLTDIIPATQGSVGPGTGISRTLSAAQILGSNGLIYAGDPEWVGGVKADGATDDTNAWAVALNAARLLGTWVVAPVGVSIISSITVPANVGIIGRSAASDVDGGSTVLGSVISSTSSIAPAILLNNYSQLCNVQVDGNTAQSCIRALNGAVQLYDVTCFGGAIGVDFNFSGVESIVSNCRIYQCGIGITNPVETRITGTLISSCSNHGILLGADCNKNVITGCQIEWSLNDNIHMDGIGTSCENNVITGNIIDAAGHNNISMRVCRHSTVTGNTIGRAARGVVGGAVGTLIDANILIGNCLGVAFTGNALWIGQNDGNVGYKGPYYAIWDDGGNGLSSSPTNIFSGNILTCHNNTVTLPVPPLPINTTDTFNTLVPSNVVYWI